jgi:hypothetical protein
MNREMDGIFAEVKDRPLDRSVLPELQEAILKLHASETEAARALESCAVPSARGQ